MDVKDDEIENRLLILLISRYTKKRYIRKRKRKHWVREIFTKRNEQGLYLNLDQEL